ncbi:MAG: twin-arginine translocase TatA/TatE family subunit [Bdellovibrionota bacterium]
MFGLSGSHLLILGLIVLLFGSRRIPELGSSLGKGLKAFKDAMDGKNAGPLEEKRENKTLLADNSDKVN